MKTELLVIKCGDEYIRVNSEEYSACKLDKTSVFPVAQLNIVQEHIEKMKVLGFKDLSIKKLIITEEDL